MSNLKKMIIGLLASAAPGVAMAAPPPAVFILYNFSHVVNGYTSGSFSGPDFTASLTTLPSMTIDTTASSDIFGLFGQKQQYIGLVYVWAEVLGPSSVSVPIDVNYFETASTFVTPGGYAAAQSQFMFYDGVNPAVAVGQLNVVGTSSGSKSAGGTYSMNVLTNTPFYVAMSGTDTLYGFSNNAGLGEKASIFMDPMIYIDHSFGSTAGYSLQISSGIQNIGPSSAPEPATWAMMLVGAGALGATMRQQRRKLAVHAA